MKSRIGALLLALPVTAGGFSLFGMRTKASAESTPAYWTGADGSGVVAVYEGGDCPIEVKRETLTFRITDLPLVSSRSAARSLTRVVYCSTVRLVYFLKSRFSLVGLTKKRFAIDGVSSGSR